MLAVAQIQFFSIYKMNRLVMNERPKSSAFTTRRCGFCIGGVTSSIMTE
jgi:hypothetical protein